MFGLPVSVSTAPSPQSIRQLVGFRLDDADYAIAITRIREIILMKPLTYMNRSGLSVRQLSDFYKVAPEEIIIDLDTTDEPLHGHQEGRFFHGYYDCYCYMPLYVFCGDQLRAAKLRLANIDGAACAVEEIGRIVRRVA